MKPQLVTSLFLCIFFIYGFNFSNAYSNSLLDFEQFSSSVVIEVRQIQVPAYPFAFNPSIVKWQGHLVMSFRDIYDPFLNQDLDSAANSWIGIVLLDEEFNPIGAPHLLDLQGASSIPSRAEDPRLISVGEHLYIVYSDNLDEWPTKGGYRMHIAELHFKKGRFFVSHITSLLNFEGENPRRREKNWVPFEKDGELLLAYSLNPHRILKPFLKEKKCDILAETIGEWSWSWGELRGGTPAVLLENGQYLGFFHSSINCSSIFSNGANIRHYFMGAYTFSSETPFNLLEMSQCPLMHEKFYADNIYNPYWKPLNVVFPGGFIMDDQFIWLVYGRHDHEMWVAKLDKQALLDSLSR